MGQALAMPDALCSQGGILKVGAPWRNVKAAARLLNINAPLGLRPFHLVPQVRPFLSPLRMSRRTQR